MTKIKSLVVETAIYGIPSIVGRFLNYLLVPLYTYNLAALNYGIVSNLYGWIAFLLVFLTFGMETGFFRYASDKGNEKVVFGTSFTFVSGLSMLFLLLVFIFQNGISSFLEYQNYKDLLLYTALILAFDAISAIPFAKLRLEKRPILFAAIKMANISINIFSNVLFFVIFPLLLKHTSLTLSFFNEDYLLQYIFISNLAASVCTLVLLIVFTKDFKLDFSSVVLKSLLKYSFPIAIVGLAGMINMYGDRILFPFLIKDSDLAKQLLGIYSANYKIGVLMVLFTQAFRYAYEPFIFSNKTNLDSRDKFGQIMTHFVWFGMLIILSVMLFIPYIQYIIGESYREGIRVVPYILVANLLAGIYFNLSVAYKLTDKTRYGAYFALLGSIVTLSINILFVPQFGYMASAWAAMLCNVVMVLLSFFFMRKYYLINYNYLRLFEYIIVAVLLLVINNVLGITNHIIVNIVRSLSVVLYVAYYVKRENILKNLR